MGIGSKFRKIIKSAGKTTLNIAKKGAPILGGAALAGLSMTPAGLALAPAGMLGGGLLGGMLSKSVGGRSGGGGRGGGGGAVQPKEPRQQMPQFSRNWADPTQNMHNSQQGGMMQGFSGGWNSQFGGDRSVAPSPMQPIQQPMQSNQPSNNRFQLAEYQQPQPQQQHASMGINPMQFARPQQMPTEMLPFMNMASGMLSGRFNGRNGGMQPQQQKPIMQQQQQQQQQLQFGNQQQQPRITPQMMSMLGRRF